MDVLVILYGFVLFVFCFFIHVMIWRMRHPKHQALTLAIIFFVIPLVCNIVVLNGFDNNGQPAIITHLFSLEVGDLLLICLLHFALSVAYIFSYPAAQAGCPTFIILATIRSSMPRGVTKDEILTYFSEQQLFGSRIEDLVDESLVVSEGEWLEITKKGRWILSTFSTLRKAFGLPVGRG
jgi:hypothetical protein